MSLPPRQKDRVVRRIVVSFTLISIVLVGIAVEAVRSITRSGLSSDWVNHTHAIILELEALRSALAAGEGGMHIYLLTGDVRDRNATEEVLSNLGAHVEIIKALTQHDPGTHEQSRHLESLSTRYLGALRAILDTRRAGDPAAARAMLDEGASALLARDFRRKIQNLKNEEMGLLTARDTTSYRLAQRTRWTVWLGVAVGVLLLGGGAWLIRHDIDGRRRAALALETANHDLEARVDERTAALQDANGQLLTDNLERQWSNQALEHQAHYDRLIIDSIYNLVLVLTKAMNISRINPAVTLATGIRAPDLINMPLDSILELLPGRGSIGPGTEGMTFALKAGREVRGVGLLRREAGGKVPVRVTLCPLRDGNKVVGGIVILEIVQPPVSPA